MLSSSDKGHQGPLKDKTSHNLGLAVRYLQAAGFMRNRCLAEKPDSPRRCSAGLLKTTGTKAIFTWMLFSKKKNTLCATSVALLHGAILDMGAKWGTINGSGAERLVYGIVKGCVGPEWGLNIFSPPWKVSCEVCGEQGLHLTHISVAWHFHPSSLSGDLENTAEMEKGRNRVSPFILLS